MSVTLLIVPGLVFGVLEHSNTVSSERFILAAVAVDEAVLVVRLFRDEPTTVGLPPYGMDTAVLSRLKIPEGAANLEADLTVYALFR